MSWTDNLVNPTFKTAVVAAIADGVMTYDEILALIKSLASGGLTATELSDLQAVYTNSQTIFSSNYVKTITYNLIYGDAANKSWWGGSKSISDVETLGSLGAQSSELVMNRLIGKWFLGTDLPMPIAGGDTATGKASTSVFSYATATGSLFVNGAAANDINQGGIGDCYLVAALGSLAYSKASVITDMFTANSNGTYGVTFYGNGGSHYTTVNKQIVISTQYGVVAGATNQSHSLAGEMWVSLAEKAYVQLNTQFDVDNWGSDWKGENSYQAIEGGFAQALKQVANLKFPPIPRKISPIYRRTH